MARILSRILMTAEGRAKLEAELDCLLKERHVLIDLISVARGHGDLSENAEYHSARERQSFVEGRIQELENMKSLSEVVEESNLRGDTIKFGATVKLLEVEESSSNRSVLQYKIVSEYEADVSQGLLSINSPLASALIGKKKDEYAEVKTPKGEKLYQVIGLEFK